MSGDGQAKTQRGRKTETGLRLRPSSLVKENLQWALEKCALMPKHCPSLRFGGSEMSLDLCELQLID